MKRLSSKTLMLGAGLALVLATVFMLSANPPWGFWAHMRANRVAVFTLPNEMFVFYKPHIEYLTENAVNPDRRRHSSKGEAPRHYIDVDHYGEYPFEMVPRKWEDAVAKYTEDTLQAWGIVPWHVQVMQARLTEAFKRMNKGSILFLSADLGHYIADAHVPLHTTENYNGQLTGQHGIHGFWESRLPELFADEQYDFFLGKAQYINDPLEKIWDVVLESHAQLDSVLGIEKRLSQEFPGDQKYSFEKRGATTVKVYSEDFSRAYHEALQGMVESRLRETIITIGSFWYTAWVNAGSPDLSPLMGGDEIIEYEGLDLLPKDSLPDPHKTYGRPHQNSGTEGIIEN